MPHQFITLSKNAKNITGQRFGRLFALGPVGKRARGGLIWLCRCDCGKEVRVGQGSLANGTTRSCGCLKNDASRERLRKKPINPPSHGMATTPLYNIWKHILQRCLNPNSPQFYLYGARGIGVHSEWQHDFVAFHSHVTQLPDYKRAGYSLDRINNNGDYEPGNVRWATSKQQLRNTRLNVNLTFGGKTQCVAAWSEEIGVSKNTLHDRLRRGWSVERTLSVVPGSKRGVDQAGYGRSPRNKG